MPLHADIQVRSRKLGLDCLTPILWHKIANGVTEAEGNGAGFYGKPYQPGSIMKNDAEFILLLRKGGGISLRHAGAEGALDADKEGNAGLAAVRLDRHPRCLHNEVEHPAPYPVELAERLIRLFSFAGDTVLDPFLGTASTTVAAIHVGTEFDRGGSRTILPGDLPKEDIAAIARVKRMAGATTAEVISD